MEKRSLRLFEKFKIFRDIMEEDSSKSSGGSGNTKQIPPAKHWSWTLNNHTSEDVELLKSLSSSIVPVLTFQEEVGEGGTPHLQGTLSFKSKGRPFGLGLNSKIHWEKTRCVEKSREYSVKEDTRKEDGIRYVRGWEPPEEPYVEQLELEPWMSEICELIEGPVDPRAINWYWEEMGGMGKTKFCKYVYTHFERVVVLGGKAADMKNAIVAYESKTKRLPKVVLIDIPRCSHDFISYQGIEEVKNMFFFSGKYEGGMICGEPPHLIVFANHEPNWEKMSGDRWRVKHLRNSIYSS